MARGSVEDPRGRTVWLSEERWAHITERHPELQECEAGVLRAVRDPDRLVQGRRPDEASFYFKTDVPSQWLKVVVAYVAGPGQIVTAFARRSVP